MPGARGLPRRTVRCHLPWPLARPRLDQRASIGLTRSAAIAPRMTSTRACLCRSPSTPLPCSRWNTGPAMSTRKTRGFTLAELIVLIVVISIALAGVMLAFSAAVRNSADPMVTKQALAIAEGLLDEIQLSSYAAVAGTGPNRQDFNDVQDYNLYTTAGGMV